jgi:hypothetical protein
MGGLAVACGSCNQSKFEIMTTRRLAFVGLMSALSVIVTGNPTAQVIEFIDL